MLRLWLNAAHGAETAALADAPLRTLVRGPMQTGSSPSAPGPTGSGCERGLGQALPRMGRKEKVDLTFRSDHLHGERSVDPDGRGVKPRRAHDIDGSAHMVRLTQAENSSAGYVVIR